MYTGLIGTTGRQSRPLDRVKSFVLNEETDKIAEGKQSGEIRRAVRRVTDEKSQDAIAFIKQQADPSNCDVSPYADETDTLYLPYKKVSHLFAEYENYHADNNKPKHLKAGESTFRHVFYQVAKECNLKLSGGSGMLFKNLASTY